ncbi:hypothetical protein [Streptomyces sp. NPDC057412]|uniref:hypothetical protein n=1 Tax=Streptomyces sp. NPDC057412 TaxID=3346123 RepID=UPI0036C66D82
MAGWLLDQIALRDAHAQQLRAVLEPDLTDYARDRRADGTLLGTAPVLDEARAAHLAQARDARPRLHRRRALGPRCGNPRRCFLGAGAPWPAVPNSACRPHR